MRKIAFFLAVCWTALAVVGQTASTGLDEPDRQELLAAETLRFSARALFNASSETPARSERVVAIVRFADRLDQDNPRTHRILADIYTEQGKTDQVAYSLEICLKHHREDHSLGLRWLQTKLETVTDANQRIELLRSISGDGELPPDLRAEAALRLANILDERGEHKSGFDALTQSLKLSPDHPVALQQYIALQESPSAKLLAHAILDQLRGNPSAFNVAWSLAVHLGNLGLYDGSLKMYQYARTVFERQNPGQSISPQFAIQHLNVMLDANRPEDALENLRSVLKSVRNTVDLQFLEIEILRAAGEHGQARQKIRSLEARYKAKLSIPGTSKSPSAVLAWCYLVIDPQPKLALEHAKQAMEDANEPTIQRIFGAAELMSGNVARGEARLRELMDKDPYAAAFLTEHYFSKRDILKATETVAIGTTHRRTGSAFRRFLAAAKKNRIKIPPAKGRDEVAELLTRFDQRYFQMGLHPEEFLFVTIRPICPRLGPGQPIEVQLAMSNVGPIGNSRQIRQIPIPLGEWGLVLPVMSFEVKIENQTKKVFRDIPPAAWFYPRHLRGGKNITRTVRLDVGSLGELLFTRPLDDLQLTVTATLNPVPGKKNLPIALPMVSPKPFTITRTGLLGDFDRSSPDAWVAAYKLALGRIVRDIKRGELPARMAAARKVASLLALVRQVELRNTELPEQLSEVVQEPVLLSMLRAVLNDRSPVVRAEMLTALQRVELNESMMMLLSGVISDSSALVRFRAAELLGESDPKTNRPVLKHLAGDGDELVRAMANAFLPK